MIAAVLKNTRYKLPKKQVEGVWVVDCTVDEAIEIMRTALLEQINLHPKIIEELRWGDLPFGSREEIKSFGIKREEEVKYVRLADPK